MANAKAGQPSSRGGLPLYDSAVLVDFVGQASRPGSA